jgi:hypothetical protein
VEHGLDPADLALLDLEQSVCLRMAQLPKNETLWNFGDVDEIASGASKSPSPSNPPEAHDKAVSG